MLSAGRAEIRKWKMKITYLHHYNSRRNVINRAKSNDKQAINIIALELAFKIRDKRAVLVPVPSNNGLPFKLVRAICRYTGNRFLNLLTKKTDLKNHHQLELILDLPQDNTLPEKLIGKVISPKWEPSTPELFCMKLLKAF